MQFLHMCSNKDPRITSSGAGYRMTKGSCKFPLLPGGHEAGISHQGKAGMDPAIAIPISALQLDVRKDMSVSKAHQVLRPQITVSAQTSPTNEPSAEIPPPDQAPNLSVSSADQPTPVLVPEDDAVASVMMCVARLECLKTQVIYQAAWLSSLRAGPHKPPLLGNLRRPR